MIFLNNMFISLVLLINPKFDLRSTWLKLGQAQFAS